MELKPKRIGNEERGRHEEKRKQENQCWVIGEEDREERRVRRGEREMKEKSEKIMKRGKDSEENENFICITLYIPTSR